MPRVSALVSGVTSEEMHSHGGDCCRYWVLTVGGGWSQDLKQVVAIEVELRKGTVY